MVRLSLFGRARRRTRGRQGAAAMGALTRLLPAILLLAATPAKADEVERWRPMIEEASTRFGIPTSWIERVMRAESRGLTMLNGRPIRRDRKSVVEGKICYDRFAHGGPRPLQNKTP